MDPRTGEQVFFHGHPSWRSIIGFYMKGILVAIIAGVIAGLVTDAGAGHVQEGWIAVVVVVALLLLFAVGLVRRIRTTYTISDQRLTINTGIVSREMHETRLERVQNVNARQSMLERLLRVGTVDFDTAAGAEYDFSFRGVSNPREIVLTVDRALHELRQTDPAV